MLQKIHSYFQSCERKSMKVSIKIEEENDIGFFQVEVDVDAAEKLMVGRSDQNLQIADTIL